MSEFIFDQIVLFYLWIITLSLALSSFITFTKFYSKIRKTIIGRVAFFVSICFLLWVVATMVLAVPSIAEIQIYIRMFLIFASFAGIAGIFAAYNEALISNILTPSAKSLQRFPYLARILCSLSLVVALIGIFRFAFNSSFLNSLMEGMSINTALGFAFIVGPLVVYLQLKRHREFVYMGVITSSTIALLALIGHWLEIPILYSPFPGGGTSIATAIGLIISGIELAIFCQKDLRLKFVKLILSVMILLISVLAISGYIFHIPVLYSASSFARLSIPTAVCFLLIAVMFFLNSWRNGYLENEI